MAVGADESVRPPTEEAGEVGQNRGEWVSVSGKWNAGRSGRRGSGLHRSGWQLDWVVRSGFAAPSDAQRRVHWLYCHVHQYLACGSGSTPPHNASARMWRVEIATFTVAFRTPTQPGAPGGADKCAICQPPGLSAVHSRTTDGLAGRRYTPQHSGKLGIGGSALEPSIRRWRAPHPAIDPSASCWPISAYPAHGCPWIRRMHSCLCDVQYSTTEEPNRCGPQARYTWPGCVGMVA